MDYYIHVSVKPLLHFISIAGSHCPHSVTVFPNWKLYPYTTIGVVHHNVPLSSITLSFLYTSLGFHKRNGVSEKLGHYEVLRVIDAYRDCSSDWRRNFTHSKFARRNVPLGREEGQVWGAFGFTLCQMPPISPTQNLRYCKQCGTHANRKALSTVYLFLNLTGR